MPAAHSMRMQHNAREGKTDARERERVNVYGLPEWFGSVRFYTVHCSLDWNLCIYIYILTTSSATSCSHANKQSRMKSVGASEHVIEWERERGSDTISII